MNDASYPDGHRGGPRPERRQGGPDRRHALQRRRQPPRPAGRFPGRQEGLRHPAPRPARGLRAVRQVDQAVHRPDGRGQLLRRPPLPGRVQDPGHRPDAGHARARARGPSSGGNPQIDPDPALRHPPGRLADARRQALREQPARAGHPGQERAGRHVPPGATSRSRPRSRSC
ncbi:MAG: hypothetical protein MZU91_11110 [Desulfosudis oleivorans]|nr:hypothetical protein [Desulfosudis oleivorans]